jgi:hypothetical protein
VRELNVLELQETDSEFVGLPMALAIEAGTGDSLVFDFHNGSALRFDRTGGLVRKYGRRGTSITDVNSLTAGYTTEDHVVLIDHGSNLLRSYDLVSGAITDTVRFYGFIGTYVPFAEHAPWLGSTHRMQTEQDSNFLRAWRAGTTDLPLGGPLPRDYFDMSVLKVHSGAVVIEWLDRIVVAPMAANGIVLFGPTGVPSDTLAVPALRRRGVSRTRVRRAGNDITDFVNSVSRLAAMNVGADSALVLVHDDATTNKKKQLRSKLFVSVIDSQGTRACVDGMLSIEAQSQVNVQIRADTIFALYQVNDGQERATRIATFLIELTRCSWTNLQRGASLLLD